MSALLVTVGVDNIYNDTQCDRPSNLVLITPALKLLMEKISSLLTGTNAYQEYCLVAYIAISGERIRKNDKHCGSSRSVVTNCAIQPSNKVKPGKH
jgi:hypothetical protein